jgi:hypothetical protein
MNAPRTLPHACSTWALCEGYVQTCALVDRAISIADTYELQKVVNFGVAQTGMVCLCEYVGYGFRHLRVEDGDS